MIERIKTGLRLDLTIPVYWLITMTFLIVAQFFTLTTRIDTLHEESKKHDVADAKLFDEIKSEVLIQRKADSEILTRLSSVEAQAAQIAVLTTRIDQHAVRLNMYESENYRALRGRTR